jgi:hypothetical protein
MRAGPRHGGVESQPRHVLAAAALTGQKQHRPRGGTGRRNGLKIRSSERGVPVRVRPGPPVFAAQQRRLPRRSAIARRRAGCGVRAATTRQASLRCAAAETAAPERHSAKAGRMWCSRSYDPAGQPSRAPARNAAAPEPTGEGVLLHPRASARRVSLRSHRRAKLLRPEPISQASNLLAVAPPRRRFETMRACCAAALTLSCTRV